MARKIQQLEDTQIKKAKPEDSPLRDGKGLLLIITQNSKLWRFRYERPITKKRNDLSIGAYPAISLAEARRIREQYRALLAQGIDPQEYKKQEELKEQQRIINTFGAVAEQWKENNLHRVSNGTLKALTLEKYWGIISNYLLPKLSHYPITEITPAIVKPVLEIPYKQNKAEMFRKSVKLLNSILNYAVNNLFLIEYNPCEKITSAFTPLSKGHNPTIKPDDLPEFLERLNNSNIELLTKYLIQWQLLTMVRPNEAVTAEYTDIDEQKGIWAIPSHKMKQTKVRIQSPQPHIVPLSKQALSLLKKIKSLTGHTDYLFFSLRGKKTKHLSNQTANKAIKDGMGYKGEQVAHAMRDIASTYLHELGVMPDVVEMCLAHTIGGIRGVYNKAEYLAHRKTALQQWGNYVEQCQLKAVAPHLKIVA